MRKNYYILLVIVFIFNSCYDYRIVNERAPQGCFYPSETVNYRGLHSGSKITFETTPVDCHQEDSKIESRTSTHTYSWYYPEICAQRLDEQNNSRGLSHWIRSYGSKLDRNIILIFEKDRIELPAEQSLENLGVNVHLGTDSIDGIHFDPVYVARPNPESHFRIDSIYYVPNQGVIRFFTSDGEIWERIF